MLKYEMFEWEFMRLSKATSSPNEVGNVASLCTKY